MASAEGWRRSLQGLSEAAFRERFGTEEACRAALFEMRWREGLPCPACGHRGFCALKTRRLFQCNRCKKPVRLTAGTVFQDSKLPLTVWLLAIHHLSQSKGGISSIELARRLGVRQPTAWLLKHKLMRVMTDREAKKPKLQGRVEIDDAYLGGERSGGKRGRGAAGKTPIVAAVETTAERKPRRLKLTVVKGFRKQEIAKLAKRDLAPGSNVVSDGLSCWPAVAKAGCRHFPMVTGSGPQAARWAPFRWVNTVLGNIKTAIAGTYHHVSAKHAQSYLTSFAYRLYGALDVKLRSSALPSFLGRLLLRAGNRAAVWRTTLRGEPTLGRGSSRHKLVFGGSVGTRAMMQPCASAAKLRAAGPFFHAA